jgi:hypothetical protein
VKKGLTTTVADEESKFAPKTPPKATQPTPQKQP